MSHYYSNGKLLLTGEYVVLDGALSLAVPTKLGQSLTIESNDASKLMWRSLDETGTIWFEEDFSIGETISASENHNNPISTRLLQILTSAKELNPQFLTKDEGFKVTTHLYFPKDWGLGSSSTLVNNIANWAKVDAFELLRKTFGGSGYDIACGQSSKPITYQLVKGQPISNTVDFNPSFKAHLYFVYLNKKQNSRDGIAQYKKNTSNLSEAISEIKHITERLIHCHTLEGFQKLIDRHEEIISSIIQQKPIKELLFPDLEGSIKSLGAWGGDFVLVASGTDPKSYFNAKGYHTILSYNEMVL